MQTRWMILGLMAALTGCVEPSNREAVPRVPETFVPVEFPQGFLWGTAEAAWQVEGDYPADGVTPRSNWSIWTREFDGAKGEINPEGAGFYRLYEDDLDRGQALGLNAFRMGVEWARIEPQNDQWNEAAIEHYVRVIKAARARGMTPMITFWHWVVPDWISDPSLARGDPARDQLAVPYNQWLYDEFAEFVSHVVPYIGDDVDLYSVLNEPWSVIAGAYVGGVFPPGESLDLESALNVHANLIFMQARAGAAIRRYDTGDADGDGRAYSIGTAKASSLILPIDTEDPYDVQGAANYNRFFNSADVDAWTTGKIDVNGDGDTEDLDTVPPEGYYAELDDAIEWLGIQYYGPIYVKGFAGDPPFTALPAIEGLFEDESMYPNTEFNFQIRPSVFLATLEYFWNRYGLPIYITENGTADCDDNQRPRHIVEHLHVLGRALDDATGAGIDVRGYFHWSLTDNFEWAEGTRECFGLYAVNYDTFERTKRGSADVYASVIAAQGIDAAMYRRAYDSGYDGDPSVPMETTLSEIEAEIANGVAASLEYKR